MSPKKSEGFFSNIKSDAPASLVVFLVAMPLCLGIALASGAPLFSGIIAGIVGGTVVALLSGSPLGVSGPAAGLAAIVYSAIQDLPTFEVFLFAVVVAGVIQILFSILKAGVIGYYFPSSVIKGMLSGIGIIIFLKQIPHAFGYDQDYEGDINFHQRDGENTFTEIGNMLDQTNMEATIISMVALGILLLWERPFMKKKAIFNIIQGPLVAVLSGIGLNLYFQSTGKTLDPSHLVNIPVAESFNGFIDQFTTPDFSAWDNPKIYILAATMALVASLETLLCVEATDKLDPQKRVTPTNRELMAQGVGNIVSGFIGGLPITQVIVRSSANIQSGGKTKASAFIHGILLLVTAAFIPEILNLIPLASLAAILFIVGYKLAKPSLFKLMYKAGWEQFLPFIVTIVVIVFSDLLWGIGMGMAVAIIFILWKNYMNPYRVSLDDHKKGEPITIQLAQEVSFLNKARLQRTLQLMPEDSTVIVDGSKTVSIHPDVTEILENFAENAKSKNIIFEVRGLSIANKDANPVERFNRMIDDTK
ncbi:SulP family inorganic anion transporter [bacterium]|nr:SulP family inorganic anion transporter [bacterium]